jgi:alpha-L-rhamnosidase
MRAAAETPPATNLRVEHLDHPTLGIDCRAPRLSWWLPKAANRQVAYRILASNWDSGRIRSDESVLVPYAGPPLESRQRFEWRVKVWTDLGESEWSEPAIWEMGLLEPSDWTAVWIGPDETSDVRAQPTHPAYLLRSTFALDESIVRARVYATARGLYELFVNGQRVGDIELAPGFTSYHSTLQVQAYDVTDLLTVGENVVGAILADGWFRGQVSALRRSAAYGDSVSLLAQVHIDHPNGASTVFGTSPHWWWSTGAVTAADLMEGETVDFTSEKRRWCTPGAASIGWEPAIVFPPPTATLRSSPAPPVRRVQELRPVKVTRVPSGRQIVDFGQNINGWIRLQDLGPKGTTLTLIHGEAVNGSGEVTLSNVRLDPNVLVGHLAGEERVESLQELSNLRRPFQLDRVTSAGVEGDIFEPRHTTHGFRFVSIEGHPQEIDPESVSGVAVHTDLRRIGSFECSDERLNRLHHAADWTFRGNACDIPTDNPTRERAGWGADWQHVFAPAAAFLFDIAGFTTKWLRDLAADQRADGCVSNAVPNFLGQWFDRALGRYGSAAWADAIVMPWLVYQTYGDIGLLNAQWESMERWLAWVTDAAASRRHPSRAAAGPTAPHERFIWDTGFHFGDWMEPDREFDREAPPDRGIAATAYFARGADLLAEIAHVLGRQHDARRYTRLATSVKEAWRAEFVTHDGRLVRDTQANYVRALAFNLVGDEHRAAVAQRLAELVGEADNHIATGILGAGLLLPELADAGYPQLAYEVLMQESQPSWFTMLERGATTIWETFDAVDKAGRLCGDGFHALNQPAFGAVIGFLHTHIAGIRQIAGIAAYRRFRVAPIPGGGLTWARATHESPYGLISVSWTRRGQAFALEIEVPPLSIAEVLLPNGERKEAQPGSHHFACDVRNPGN